MSDAQPDEARRLYLAIGAEIRHARGNRSAASLGEAIGRDQTSISNYERGGTIPLQVLWQIEDELGLRRGELQTRAGAVDPDVVPVNGPTEQAIREDPDLDEPGRELVLYAYSYCVSTASPGADPVTVAVPRSASRVQATREAGRATEEQHRRDAEAERPVAG